MPKEYIRNSQIGVNTHTGEEVDLNPHQVEVGWSKEAGHVQIATTDPKCEDTFSKEAGLYFELDRRSINDLIRLLRKARDQAFGRDE